MNENNGSILFATIVLAAKNGNTQSPPNSAAVFGFLPLRVSGIEASPRS
jgi:hypothetical protein